MTTPTDPVGERDLLSDLSAKWRDRFMAQEKSAYPLGPSRDKSFRQGMAAAYNVCADDLDAIRADHTLVRTAELEALVEALHGMLNNIDGDGMETVTGTYERARAALAPFERKEEVK